MALHLWHDLDPEPAVPEVLNVIVEIPRGSRNKYEYDKRTGAIKLDLERVRTEALGWEGPEVAKERVKYAIDHHWDMRAGRLGRT